MKLYYSLLLLVFSLNVNGKDGQLNIGKRDIFKKETIRSVIYYSKVENSGCITKLKLRNGSSTIRITHGSCDNLKSNQLETARSIAGSVQEIIEHYKLK